MVKNVDGFHINPVSKKSPIDYALEVDLEYPGKLHLLHQKNLQFLYDMLLDCCKIIADEYGINVCDEIKSSIETKMMFQLNPVR